MTKLDRLGNKILERLPDPDFRRIVGLMEKVCPEVGEIVAFPDKEPKWVHFPVSGVLSSMVVLEDGSTVEASTIGNEGMDGLYLLADPLANPYRINVQVQGDMYRMPARAFKQALHESHPLSQLLLRYAMVLIQRGAQNGACIQHHTIEERMCRWLLETAHRKGEDRFGLTQEFLADMLGVRRQSVNLTARVLQQANLIKYHRGELTIVDRAGLEDSSCECFRVTSQMYERMMRLDSGTAGQRDSGTAGQRDSLISLTFPESQDKNGRHFSRWTCPISAIWRIGDLHENRHRVRPSGVCGKARIVAAVENHGISD